MELRREAEASYRKYVHSRQGNTTDDCGMERERLFLLLLPVLTLCPPHERFQFPVFSQILEESCLVPTFQPDTACQAFKDVENYCMLLLVSPWKQEYHRIKKFGGYYRCRIGAHLKGVEALFRLIGYTEVTAGLLCLTETPTSDVLIGLGFESLIAAMECKVIGDAYSRLEKPNKTLVDVVRFRLQYSGSAAEVSEALERSHRHMSDSEFMSHTVPQRSRGSKFDASQSFTAPFRTKLQEHMKAFHKHSVGSDEHIPFIDDDSPKPVAMPDQKEGTLDDHLMASLQIVNQGDMMARPVEEPTRVNAQASEEWTFVREGLEKRYGKLYFEGARKDILKKDGDNVDETSDNVFLPRPIEPVRDVTPKVVRKIAHLDSGIDSIKNPKSAWFDSAYDSSASSKVYVPPTLSDTKPTSRSLHLSKNQSGTEVVRRRNNYELEDQRRKHASTVPLLRKENSAPANFPAYVTMPTDAHRKASAPFPSSQNQIDGVKVLTKDPHKRISVPAITKEKVIAAPPVFQARSISATHYNERGVEVPDETGAWVCSHCTLKNNASTDICDVCSKSRDSAPEMDSPIVGDTMRVCENCTLDNEPTLEQCVACGHTLRGSQTVV